MQKQPGIVGKRERSRQRARIAERIWFGVMAFLAVVVFLVASITALAAWQPTCEACHGQATRTLAADPHAAVTCDECHAGSTSFGFVQSRLSVVNMVVAKLNPFDSYVAAQVENERCLLCHADMMRGTVTANGVKMSHSAPTEKGWRCQSCHPNVGHRSPLNQRVGYTMDKCMTCHNSNPTNTSTCDVCHEDETGGSVKSVNYVTPWRVTHGSEWKTMHGMGDLDTCSGCHTTRTFCASCHHVEIPHPKTYLRTHGPDVIARANGRTDCIVCHRQFSCDNCHGLPMPHPAKFLEGHSAYVEKKGQAVCARCHDKQSCDNCHTRHIHPGLDPEYLKQLKQRPVSVP